MDRISRHTGIGKEPDRRQFKFPISIYLSVALVPNTENVPV